MEGGPYTTIVGPGNVSDTQILYTVDILAGALLMAFGRSAGHRIP
jgi:hypothetical protein